MCSYFYLLRPPHPPIFWIHESVCPMTPIRITHPLIVPLYLSHLSYPHHCSYSYNLSLLFLFDCLFHFKFGFLSLHPWLVLSPCVKVPYTVEFCCSLGPIPFGSRWPCRSGACGLALMLVGPALYAAMDLVCLLCAGLSHQEWVSPLWAPWWALFGASVGYRVSSLCGGPLLWDPMALPSGEPLVRCVVI